MNTTTLVVIGAALIAFLVIWRSCNQETATAPATAAGSGVGDPVTESISLDLKVKAQSEMTVRVLNQINGMKGLLAMGLTDGQAAKSQLDEATATHARMAEAEHQLATLGDSSESIARWKTRILWDEFTRLEGELRAATGQASGE